jgi:3-oxoacyl-[acyl-carrier protein] reductase
MVDRASEDRVVIVTGVSRRSGIGFAIAQRLLEDGAKLLLHSYRSDEGEDP